ncbi:MAG: cytochrome P450 [Pseudomonadales bacterium]|jgi:cytochrome P450|tara:strand:+ start:1500 stop:2759 length:1260 start_codon:yes stop_codon:yes gene_type:complete
MSNALADDTVQIPDPYSMPLEDVNPLDAKLFQHDAQWAYFERLRAEDPVHFSEDEEFGRYWHITKFEDIMLVEKHHDIFSSEGGITIGPPLNAPEDRLQTRMFIAMDPPTHDVQRATVSPVVQPINLAKLEGTIRERAGNILDSLPIGETFNWVDLVSIELTTQMLATLFDFPFEDRRKLTRWSDVATAAPGTIIENEEQRKEELLECLAYFTKLWNERVNAEPGSDLISMLAHGEETRNMDPMEFLGNLILLIVGGNDTTRNSISGGVLALNENPAEYDKLRADPSLIPNMVAEIIRWQTPLAYMRRTANVDTEIRGKKIKAGDRVLMWYVSGNRDDDVIENANDFIIDRAKARHHVSFGFGIHRCMGNRLAEMQLRVLWEEIMKRFERIEVVQEPERIFSSFVKGYSELMVRVHPKK